MSEVLFTVGPSGPGHLKYQGHRDDTTYDASTCNVELALIDDRTLLYVHDVHRHDPEGATGWLKYHGFGRMIGRFVTLSQMEIKAC